VEQQRKKQRDDADLARLRALKRAGRYAGAQIGVSAGGVGPQIAGAEWSTTAEKPVHPAYGAMKGLIRVMPGTDPTQPADKDWADRLETEYGREQRER